LPAQDRFELSLLARAGSKRIPERTLKIIKASSKIEVDAVLNEAAWDEAEKAWEFHQQFPYDICNAVTKTEARLTYDD